MQKRRLYLLLIGVGLVGALLAGMFRSREPEYGGKRLSEWVDIYAVTHLIAGWGSENREAVAAIRQLGTNAVPHLLKWIRYEVPPWKTTFDGIADRAPWRLKPAWMFSDKRVRLAEHAAWVFEVLGPDGEGAIPKLTLLLDESGTFDCERSAISASLIIGVSAK